MGSSDVAARRGFSFHRTDDRDVLVCHCCKEHAPVALIPPGKEILCEFCYERRHCAPGAFRRPGPMTLREFRALLDLLMASDPNPAGQKNDEILEQFANDQARLLGYENWVAAYHTLG